MKAYQLTFTQSIPVPIPEAWDFFSSPLNLVKITPPNMAFNVTSDYDQGTKMYPGMIITYKVAPLFGIQLNWMTEITHVINERYFVDEQRFGPFRFWHHQHHFRSIPGGTEMKDLLTYGLPLGMLGSVANSALVRQRLREIFDYRKRKIVELFGDYLPGVT
ncbi:MULTISPECIES: SRPBCC family protein [Pedobacter]|uniref:SRPBCC family protein n=1 Tax=Pedobacter TaxID=84567 RepID=UPI00210C266D|nr:MULTISPECIES: SRPBCC family protein [unclassified Pedobacter]